MSARQGKNWRDKIAWSDFEQLSWPQRGEGQDAWNKAQFYKQVNEHFEPIFNAVWCQLRGFTTAS